MLSENEIIIHKNQTEIIDFMEDINDTKIFKCKDKLENELFD